VIFSFSGSIYNKIYLTSFYFLLSSFSSIKTDSDLVNLLMFQNAKRLMCLLFLLFSLFYLINFSLFIFSLSQLIYEASTGIKSVFPLQKAHKMIQKAPISMNSELTGYFWQHSSYTSSWSHYCFCSQCTEVDRSKN